MRKIYLDNAATTKVDPKVAEKMMIGYLENYGNPSSLHSMGIQAEQSIKAVRKSIAETLNCLSSEVYFTSGGTEGNNMIIQGLVESKKRDKIRIITSAIEHSSILDVVNFYGSHGIEIIVLGVDEKGCISLEELKEAVNDDALLVTIMGVNNELGTIQDLETIGKVIKKQNPQCFFHTDFVQGYMKVPIDVKKCRIDGLTLCAHKIFGPKGVGAVYIKKGTALKTLIRGGGQEKNLRSGTENVPGIIGLGEAIALRKDRFISEGNEIRKLRDQLMTGVLDKVEDAKVNGDEKGSPYILSLSFDRVKGEVLLHSLEGKGIYVSTGSACSSHKKEKQYVLKAIGLLEEYKEGTIRISFSKEVTSEDVNYTIDTIAEVVKGLRLLTKIRPRKK